MTSKLNEYVDSYEIPCDGIFYVEDGILEVKLND